MTAEILPLEMLPAGASAQIDQLLGDAESIHRLQEMGLRVGTAVEMVQPGTPCIVRLSGHKLCIREGSLFQVLVRTKDAAP